MTCDTGRLLERNPHFFGIPSAAVAVQQEGWVVQGTELGWIGFRVPHDSLWIGGDDPECVVALRTEEAVSGTSVSTMSIARHSRVEID